MKWEIAMKLQMNEKTLAFAADSFPYLFECFSFLDLKGTFYSLGQMKGKGILFGFK